MIVGITGSIGSGKSTVCQYLRTKGYAVLDADAISHELMKMNQEGYNQAIGMFGNGILQPNNEIDRSVLSSIIFKDSSAKSKLEAILHPLIRKRMLDQTKTLLEKKKKTVVFWEVPLLFETNFHKDCDVTLCVVASDSDMIERVQKRSKLTKEEILVRLHSQMPSNEKKALADYVIQNDGTLYELLNAIDAFLNEICIK